MTRRLLLVGVVFALAIVAMPVKAQERVALVVGNSQYREGQTRPQAAGDAAAVADMLRAMNFEVALGTDLDREGMARMQDQFRGAMVHARIAVFFFAGRGVQSGGKNFLFPIDAKSRTVAELDAATMPVSQLVQLMSAENRVSLLFLDTDRANPLATSVPAPAKPSIVEIESVGGDSLIGFSTAPGSEVVTMAGPHSPFVSALLKQLPTPGAEIKAVMKSVMFDVSAATKGRQIPWTTSALRNDVVLVPKQPEATTKP